MEILVFHIGSLGDTLNAVPALRAVRDNYPDARLTLLTNRAREANRVRPEDILDGSGLVDEFISYPPGPKPSLAGLLLRLRRRRFDLLVYLIRPSEIRRRVGRDRLFFRLAGITKAAGIPGPSIPGGRSVSPPTEVPRVAQDLLARLQADGLEIRVGLQNQLDPGIGEREEEATRRWRASLPGDGGRRWFALGPGSKMPCKVWPLERYLAAARCLIAERNLWPVIFGGSEDRELGRRLTRELGCGYVAAGELGVRAAIAALRRCAFYLGNDTGTMHMAAAAGLRCVVPFSSRDRPGRWHPAGEGHIVLRTPVSCQGCLLEVCVEEGMRCILSITIEDVIRGCRKVLGNDDRRPG